MLIIFYIYYTENNNIDRYDNIIKGIIDFIETGKYVDYANCDEKHTSPSDSNFGNITMNLIKKIEASAQKILQKYFGIKNLVNTKITVVDLPINSIYTDVKRFQNRQNAYSEKSVEKIINAVLNNTFDIDRFDPILVWKDPKNKKTYVLSGHSRLEAFKRLYKEMGYITFATIPSKYFKGNESQAIETALNSNTQATKETAVERAFYYQRLRKNGMSEKEIENKCKEIEDKNGTYIYHLSFLNPDGYLMDALRNLDIEKEAVYVKPSFSRGCTSGGGSRFADAVIAIMRSSRNKINDFFIMSFILKETSGIYIAQLRQVREQ